VSGVKTGFKILGSLKPVINGVSIIVESLLRTRSRSMSLLLSPKCKSNLDSRGTRLFASASTTVGDAVSTARQGLINDLFKILMMCYPLKNGFHSKFRAKS